MADLNLSVTESIKLSPSENIPALAKTTPSTLVEYLISRETIFPSGYDIAAVAGDGVTMRERSLSDNWLNIQSVNNFTVSGLVIPATSVNLSIIIPLGVAYLEGRYVSVPATSVTVSPSTTSSIFLKVTRDTGGNVTGAYYEVNTTGTPPVDATPIATATAGVGTITSTTDERLLGPNGIIVLTSGTAWIVKAGLTRIRVKVRGASGGGGGGAGNAGGQTNGGAGGTTSFNGLSVTGGGGGPAGTFTGSPASRGVGSSGRLNLSGGGREQGYGGGSTVASGQGQPGGVGGFAQDDFPVTPGASLAMAIGGAGGAGQGGTGASPGTDGTAGLPGIIEIEY